MEPFNSVHNIRQLHQGRALLVGAGISVVLADLWLRWPRLNSVLVGFRQTQTSWPVQYWLDRKTFNPLHPVVPIRGYPLDWLLELPLFQWTSYGLARLTGLDASQSSQIVGLTAEIATAVSIGLLLQNHFQDGLIGFIGFTACLLLPYQLQVGAQPLIDTLATAMCLAAVLLLMRARLSQSRATVVGASFLFAVATAVKPNVAAMYLLFLALYLVLSLRLKMRQTIRALVLPACAIAIAGALWTWFSSRGIPAEDPRYIWSLNNPANRSWYYGSLDEYLHLPKHLWQIFSKTTVGLGGTPFVIAALFGLLFASKASKALALSALLAVFLNWSIFVNLNLHHLYYPIPSAPLIIVAVVLGISGWHQLVIAKSGSYLALTGFIASIMCIGAIASVAVSPAAKRMVTDLHRHSHRLSIASTLNRLSQPDELTMGIGFSNNATVLYQANRYGYLLDDSNWTIEKKYFDQLDLDEYCWLATYRVTNNEALQYILERFPNAREVSTGIFALCSDK